MFSFLSPLFLLGTAFMVLPVMIHFYVTSRHQQLKFSSLRLLTATISAKRQHRRLTNWLLLLLRLLIILLVALAMARPYLTGLIKDYAASAGQATVIIIDNSVSMDLVQGSQTLLERAQSFATRLVEQRLGRGDQLLVLPLLDSGQNPGSLSGDTQSLLAQLTALEIVYRNPDWSTTLLDARNRLLGHPNPRIVIISDFAQSNWDSLPQLKDFEVPIDVLALMPEQYDNRALVDLSVYPRRPFQGGAVHFELSLLNARNFPLANASYLAFYHQGQLVFRRALEKSSLAEGVDYRFPTAGRTQGYFLLEGDHLAADNRIDFIVDVSPTLPILVVGHGAGGSVEGSGYYTYQALLASKNGGFAPKAILWDQLGGLSLEQYQAIYLILQQPIAAAESQQLRAYVEQGGVLIVIPDGHADREQGRLLWAGKQPLAHAAWAGLPIGGATPYRLQPLTEYGLGAVGAVQVQKYYRLEYDAGPRPLRVMARLDNGHPMITENEFGRGQVVIFGLALDRSFSNLPVSPYFLPLIYSMTERLVARVPVAHDRAPEAALINYPYWQDGSLSFSTRVESTLAYLDRPAIAAKLGGGREVKFLGEDESFLGGGAAVEVGFQHRLWRLLLILVLLLLVTEEVVANVKSA